jgi:hypothetical protein
MHLITLTNFKFRIITIIIIIIIITFFYKKKLYQLVSLIFSDIPKLLDLVLFCYRTTYCEIITRVTSNAELHL